jgi:hypothetical protein
MQVAKKSLTTSCLSYSERSYVTEANHVGTDTLAEIRRDLSAFQRLVTVIGAAFAVGLVGLLGAWQF